MFQTFGNLYQTCHFIFRPVIESITTISQNNSTFLLHLIYCITFHTLFYTITSSMCLLDYVLKFTYPLYLVLQLSVYILDLHTSLLYESTKENVLISKEILYTHFENLRLYIGVITCLGNKCQVRSSPINRRVLARGLSSFPAGISQYLA